jgi:hypothetical protein
MPVIWRLHVQGLLLHGGRNHFNLGTNNTDCSFFVFTDCVFTNASGAAGHGRSSHTSPRLCCVRGESRMQYSNTSGMEWSLTLYYCPWLGAAIRIRPHTDYPYYQGSGGTQVTTG